MKNTCFLLFSLFLFGSVRHAAAQTLKGFNYQAVARDNAGAILANTNVSLCFQIHEGTTTGTIIFQEVIERQEEKIQSLEERLAALEALIKNK